MYISKVFLIIVVWSFIGDTEALPWERKFDLNEYREQSDSSDYLDTELKRKVNYKNVCNENVKKVSVATLYKYASPNEIYSPNDVNVYSCPSTQNEGLVCQPLSREIKFTKATGDVVTINVVVGCVVQEPVTTK